MLMALLPLAGWAADLVNTTQYGENGLKYKILTIKKASSDYTVSVSQNVYASNGVTALTIPATVTINVKGNDENSVAIDEAITFKVVEIEANAFQNVKAGKDGNVTSIQIGSNIKKIGANAFDGCENVASITFDANENNMEIGAEAFKGIGITSLDLSPITGKLAAVNKWWNNAAFVAGTTVNNNLTTITLPKKVSKIVKDAFAGFKKLTTVNFSVATDAEAVNLEIEEGAFQETPIVKLDLTNARIATLNKLFEDDNVTLKKVIMSKHVVTLNTNALANCIQLGRAIDADELGEGSAAETGGVDFSQSTKLTTLKGGSLSNTVVSEYDFSNCWEWPSSATYYTTFLEFSAENPFVNATTKTNKNLVTVKLPKKSGQVCPVTKIETVFANCEVLETITDLANSSITAVADGAFANDIALTELTFPKTLKTVTGAPFNGCKKLATLNFDGTALTSIGSATAVDAVNGVYSFDSYGAADKSVAYSVNGTAELISYDKSTKVATIKVLTNPGYDEYVGQQFTANIDIEGITYPTPTIQLSQGGATIPVWVEIKSETTAPVAATGDLFGDYTHVIAWGTPNTTEDIASPLQTLNITVAAGGNTAVKILKNAFRGNGAGKSALKTVNIAVGGEFKGEINDNAFTLVTNDNSTVTFGDIVTGANFSSINGPQGTNTVALTLGKYTDATLTAAPIVTGTVSKAIVKEVAKDNVLNAIGQAKVIDFQGEITAFAAPTDPNTALTEIQFNAIAMADGIIPATAFNEVNAPNLVKVTWNPATATAAFAKEAFGTSVKGVDAKVELYTTSAVADGKYGLLEANLYNVIFKAAAIPAVATNIEVYGTADATFFYGKIQAPTTSNLTIANRIEVEGVEEANWPQVMVYSAFVDGKAQNIYMDALAQNNDQFIVEKGQAVVVRVKNPNNPETYTKGTVTGKMSVVKAYTTDEESTMRYNKTGNIVNDLQVSPIVFSSDYIGTNYVGKTLYAMANPLKEGKLLWQKVNKSSYMPKGALFVETAETATARLNVVWLDGSEDVTGIIERLNDQKFNNDAIYNLQGVRVSAPVKGQIYIKNGKKFIVK